MSELLQKNDNRATIRWKLLTGASALALTAYVSSASFAKAEDGDRPQVWIELGGQLSRLQDGQEAYAPPFVVLTPSIFSQPQKAERPPLYGLDESAALTFQPQGSDWIFSASINYGRTGSGKHVHHQTYSAPSYVAMSHFHRSRNGRVHDFKNYTTYAPIVRLFTDAVTKQSESHTIIDFQAGKDLGLGLFGHDAASALNIGVRIAQFRSKSQASLKEIPDWHFQTHLSTFHTSYTYGSSHYSFYRTAQAVYQPFHSFAGNFRAKRSFSGVGPSISWNSSVPFAGNSQDGGLSVDWGVNAALLFGRQKTKIHHQTTGRFHSSYASYARRSERPITYQHAPPDHTRSRNVTVPNVGGFAGLTYNYADAKLSFGYRADFFFNAIDGGIDARKNENRAFYGPYASISIGLGD